MLRPNQQEARLKINQLLNARHHPVYVAPTGCGKTITAIEIIKDRIGLKQRIFVLIPQVEIMDQWEVEFVKNNIDYGIINSDGVQGRNKAVYLCMPISLNNMLSIFPERFGPDLIICDECHHSRANIWHNIYNYYPTALRLGLTATPQRYDGKGLDNFYTDIVQTITMTEAINAGYLAEPLGVVPELYQLNVKMQNGDYDPEEQAEQLGKVQIIGNVIEHYGNIFGGMPILVACCTHQHAEMMTEAFNEAGWNFDHIHSGLNKYERKSMLKKIRTSKLNGLCTVGIGIEGMDIAGLYGIIWLRRTMSITIYLQFIGRILRPLQGKKYGIIIDPVGNYFIHGRPEMTRQWTLKGKDEQPDILTPEMKICPQCGVMNAKVNQFCHICEFDFINDAIETIGRERKLPVMIDGKLIVLDGEELATRKEEIQKGLKEQRKEKEQQSPQLDEPKAISKQEKIQLLRDGLSGKKDLFSRAVKEWL